MRRVLLLALLLLTCTTPLCTLVGAELEPSKLEVTDDDGIALEIVGQGDTVRLRATLKNTATTNHTGVVTVVFRVYSADRGYNLSHEQSPNVDVPAGGVTIVEWEWTADKNVRGNFTAEAYNEAVPGKIVRLNFRVESTSVRKGTILDSVVEYAWLYGLFALTFVLFVSVMRLRRPRS